MTEPKFQRGDLVRHRASGERALVIASNPPAPPVNEWSYDLDPGFYADGLTYVPEWVLEPVDPEPEGEASPCE